MLYLEVDGEEIEIPREIEAAGGEAIEAYLVDQDAAWAQYVETGHTEAELAGKTVAELQRILAEVGLTEDDVDGSGTEGRNLKADYIREILAAGQ